ncbi:MAG: NAD(P)H-hydrate dehydratase [Candidatus Bipolaricaulia bacterium]
MKILTGEGMKAFDAEAIDDLGIPSLILMENAGLRVAEAVSQHWDPDGIHVLAMSGKGNNGGDALCAARHLIQGGASAEAVIVGAPDKLSEETTTQARILEHFGVEIRYVDDEADVDGLDDTLWRADVVLDGLLGIGVKGAVRGLHEPVIERVNVGPAHVVAIDAPSGVEADTGHVEGVAIGADLTVTLEYPKIGLLLYPGRDHVGDLLVRTIGYPDPLKNSLETGLEWIDHDGVRERLPERLSNSHKGDHGHVLVLAGSRGLSGAAIMTADAALRCGAGLVHMGHPQSLNPVVESRVLEAVKFPLPEIDGALAETATAQILEMLSQQRMDAIAVGPGLSQHESVRPLLHELLPSLTIPLVLDADGINNLADDAGRKLLRDLDIPVILTPHPGELARLMDRSIADVERDRVGAARGAAQDLEAVLVLKGAPTVTALPSGDVFVNSTGNSGLATGGSGDVLTGMIVGLMAQGMAPEDAAPAGVYLHGLLADRLTLTMGKRAMLPRDLLNEIPNALKSFEQEERRT